MNTQDFERIRQVRHFCLQEGKCHLDELLDHIAALEAERDRMHKAVTIMGLLARPCDDPATRLQTLHDYAQDARRQRRAGGGSMKVYVMLNHDRHHDPDVRVYADKSPAIADARSYMLDRLERLGLTPDIIADDEDEEEGFWEVYGGDGSEVVYYCNYSNEGDDYAMVIETELIGT